MNVVTVKGPDQDPASAYDAEVSTAADRIRSARRRLRLSQEDLARKIPVSKNTVARWEGGATPGGANLDALADALGVTTDWILRGEAVREDGAPEGTPAPPPPHWDQFEANYPHIDDLTAEDLEDIKAFAARRGLRITSWMRWAEIAEWVRRAKPSPELDGET